MSKFKKIANSDDINISCNSPFSPDIIAIRNNEYRELSDVKFKKKYRSYLFKPVTIELPEEDFEIQYNFCNNTFCKWYGQPQYKYANIKNKPSRYKLVHRKTNTEDTLIICNDIPSDVSYGAVIGNHTSTVSNWSVAEEIKRLIEINSIVPIEPKYMFHRDGCENSDKSPFTDSNQFYKRGTSNTNSIKYQCKECMKITNVLPEQQKCFNYHQKRNDILVQFVKDIMSRTPVRRTCEKLSISPSTYYNKLEWIYRKCLEFNERHETNELKNKQFDKIWLNTDMMIYNLNNIKQKGFGRKKGIGIKDKKIPIYVVASADLYYGYVFRADVAYRLHLQNLKTEKNSLLVLR